MPTDTASMDSYLQHQLIHGHFFVLHSAPTVVEITFAQTPKVPAILCLVSWFPVSEILVLQAMAS